MGFLRSSVLVWLYKALFLIERAGELHQQPVSRCPDSEIGAGLLTSSEQDSQSRRLGIEGPYVADTFAVPTSLQACTINAAGNWGTGCHGM